MIREYFITDHVEWFENRKDWEKLNSIDYERKTIIQKGAEEVSIEERYFLCSIKSDAEWFAIVVRRYWQIENIYPHIYSQYMALALCILYR